MAQYLDIKIPRPYQQGLVIGGVAFGFMLVGKLLGLGTLFPWTSSAACLLLFLVFNNALSIFSDQFLVYAQESLLTFALTLIGLGLMAWLLSGLSINDAPPFRTIYLVMVMAYGSLLALCFFLRSMVDYLRRKDEERVNRRR